MPTFTVGTDRVVLAQPTKLNSRVVILNALRTVTPALGALILGDMRVDLVIYDFYFEDHTLRMVVLVLDTFQVIDAFSLEHDLLHLLRIHFPAQWGKGTPGASFRNFFIKNNVTGFLTNLNSGIPESVRCEGRLSKKWMLSTPRGFLADNLTYTPAGYVPFGAAVAAYLHSRPRFCTLTDDWCISLACGCFTVPRPSNPADLLKHIPNTISQAVVTWIQPCFDAIRMAQKIAWPLNHERKVAKNSSKKRKIAAVGKSNCCVLSAKCSGKRLCYWVECCTPQTPATCLYHGRRHVRRTPGSLSACPRHGQIGQMAQLFNV